MYQNKRCAVVYGKKVENGVVLMLVAGKITFDDEKNEVSALNACFHH
jgi:hypothetical protein